jgi:hypothetical protein
MSTKMTCMIILESRSCLAGKNVLVSCMNYWNPTQQCFVIFLNKKHEKDISFANYKGEMVKRVFHREPNESIKMICFTREMFQKRNEI